MKQQPEIRLLQGATSIVELDLTGFELQGGKIVFTMRKARKDGEIIKTWEFETQETHNIVFSDEFTATLDTNSVYEYDIMWHLDGERFAQCLPSPIRVTRTVGGYRDAAGN